MKIGLPVRFVILSAMICAAFAALPLHAAEATPESVRMQADNDVQVAAKLMEQAKQLLSSGGISRDKLQAAMSLYIQSGQLFEKAGKTYQALGPTYANPQEVQNAFTAMNTCISSVKTIQQRLAAG